MILAGIGILVAAFFLWRRDFDKAFVIAALGMVAWFFNYRAQMKEVVAAANLADDNEGDEIENVED
jgi:hypothetical protein